MSWLNCVVYMCGSLCYKCMCVLYCTCVCVFRVMATVIVVVVSEVTMCW